MDTPVVCMHCLRTIHPEMHAAPGVVWADETRDPYYCPKALNLTHKPQDPTDSAPR